VAITCIYLFWSKSSIVRNAFGVYDIGSVLFANFILHYLPPFVLCVYVRAYWRTIGYDYTTANITYNQVWLAVLSLFSSVLMACLYFACVDTSKKYGTSINVGAIPVIMLALAVCITATFHVYMNGCCVCE
jgi:hypothetical protein